MEIKPFWDWHACRKFIELAIEHYKGSPGWFTDWLDDLYIRLGERTSGAITLDELATLAALFVDGSWEDEEYAVNRIYRMFDRLGRDTTGVTSY